MANKKNGYDPKLAKENEQSAKKSGVLTNPIRNMIVAMLVCIGLGAPFVLVPEFVRSYCGFLIGGLLCALGLVYIIIYFCRKPVGGVYRSEFATGVVMLAAGGYVIAASLRPDAIGISITLRFLVTALGVLIAMDGVMKLQYSLDLARMKFGGWWAAFLTSLLGIALGVLTAMGLVDSFGVTLGLRSNDFINAMLALGVGFCINGLLDLIVLILVAVRNRKAAKAAAAVPEAPPMPPMAGYYAAPAYAPAPAAPAYAPAPSPAPAPAPAPAEPPKAEPAPEAPKAPSSES